MLIDSHCHLTSPPLAPQVDAAIDRMGKAGISHAITVGVDAADVRRAIELSKRCPQIFATAGVHPHEAGKVGAAGIDELRPLAANDRVVAIGETGLDYHYDFADRASQHRVFAAELALAEEIGKPVIIHCREAHADAMAILADFPRLFGVVFHCFTGSRTEAREILDAGYWVSLTGVVTFKNSDELQAVASYLPGDRFMIETDSPYLSPEPVRSKRPNEPAHVVHVARRIAELRGETFDAIAAVTRANTIRFFKLPIN